MTLHHVICHVTAVTCLFIIQKENQNQNQKKRNIKSRKINKRKRKMLALMCIITITYDCTRYKELVGGMLTNIIGFL